MTSLFDENTSILLCGGIKCADSEANVIVRAGQTATLDDHEAAVRAMAERRAKGEPLAYVTERRLTIMSALSKTQNAKYDCIGKQMHKVTQQ